MTAKELYKWAQTENLPGFHLEVLTETQEWRLCWVVGRRGEIRFADKVQDIKPRGSTVWRGAGLIDLTVPM